MPLFHNSNTKELDTGLLVIKQNIHEEEKKQSSSVFTLALGVQAKRQQSQVLYTSSEREAILSVPSQQLFSNSLFCSVFKSCLEKTC